MSISGAGHASTLSEQRCQIAMSLKRQFLTDFAGQVFTIKQAQQWYQMNKRRPGGYTYLADVYNILIKPLLWEGRLQHVGRGLYQVVTGSQNGQGDSQDEGEGDEFDKYIATKLKGGAKQ
jgi:hypothetical protein